MKILYLAESMIRLHGLKPYVLHDGTPADDRNGDIEIRFVGLNKGEKLYEELLIGENPMPTTHSRIMTATETSLHWDKLQPILYRLNVACLDFDLDLIRQIFLDAPLAFRPTGDAIHDITWAARDTMRNTRLKVAGVTLR